MGVTPIIETTLPEDTSFKNNHQIRECVMIHCCAYGMIGTIHCDSLL